jgi:hypothetical protein
LVGIRWSDVDATRVLVDASDELVADMAPRTRALQPLSLAAYPDLAAVLEAVDLDELGND